MASAEDVKQAVAPEPPRPPISRRSSSASSYVESVSSNEDAKTVTGVARESESDNESISSTASYPTGNGRRGLTLTNDESSKTVYEAWEIIYSEDTLEWDTWNVFCGIKFGVTWKSLNDGRIDVGPLTQYGQGELADLHEDAVRNYEAKGRKKGKSYDQDMANRVFGLDMDIHKRLHDLVDDRQIATNKTAYHRREWRVVVFEEGEFQLTDVLPERKKSLFRWRRPKPHVYRWFIVLRGEEVKSNKEKGGWRLFNRHYNPWWRVDAQESREERMLHREHMKKVNRRNLRQGPPPPPMGRPPTGPPNGYPRPPPPPMRPIRRA
ncbi:hypothetical protein Hte_011576 [Hypoxylon texense]